MNRAASTVGIALAAAIAFASCVSPARGDEESEPKAVAADRSLIPAEVRERPNPIPPTPEAIERGKLYFSSQCTMCHGNEGDGKGDLVQRLGLVIPDFRTEEFQKGWTDGEMHYVITEGHGRMKGEGERLPEGWKWEMILYIRSLAR